VTYTTDQLLAMTTITSSHDADLKFDDGNMRVWLSRLHKEDGEPYNNTIYIEHNVNGIWQISSCYDGDSA